MNWATALALSVSAGDLLIGPIVVKLQPQTIAAFDTYANRIENELQLRWSGKGPFLSIQDSTEELDRVLAGEVDVRPGASDNPLSVPHGLIHDWVGTIFIPHTNVQRALGVMQDFDNHSKIYADIVQSRLTSRKGNEITGEWRLRRTSPFLTLVLDVPEHEFYQEVGRGKWICRAYAKDIAEIENPGEKNEKKLPPGEGQGFLWRLYGYWGLEETTGGVLVECRTLSLTRDVPAALAWIAKPFLQSVPHESLTATLKSTRAAVLAEQR